MCGPIALHDQPDHLARRLDAGVNPDLLASWRPSWDVAPTDPIAGVSDRDGRRRLGAFKWELLPSWAKNPTAVKGTFDAGAETVASTPMFRDAFERSRLLIAVDAFYEWHTSCRDAEGHVLRTAAIITTGAGPDMPIHDREPVVLDEQDWDRWLDAGTTGRRQLQRLLVPTVAGTLVHHPVRKEVGNTRNDRPEFVEDFAIGDPDLDSP